MGSPVKVNFQNGSKKLIPDHDDATTICRICGKSITSPSDSIDIFSDQGVKLQVLDKLQFCFTPQVLDVAEHDKLPKSICELCCCALHNTYANAKKIQQFQQSLKEKFAKSNHESTSPPKIAFQQENKPLQRPTHLSLQDIFSHHDEPQSTALNVKSNKLDLPAKATNAELLSTPEGPDPDAPSANSEDFKIQDILMFPQQQQVANNTPALISPKNAELLIPTSTKMISIANTSSDSFIGQSSNSIAAAITWGEHELFPSGSALMTTASITSTLKDYRPPSKVLHGNESNNNCNKGTNRYATTIFKCQQCSNAFVNATLLEEHMKIHSDKPKVLDTNSLVMKSQDLNVECSTCHKILPSRDALKSHFQAVHNTNGFLHECSNCSKIFCNRATLKRHLLTHSSDSANSQRTPNHTNLALPKIEASFSCPKCGQTFSKKPMFNNHLLVCIV